MPKPKEEKAEMPPEMVGLLVTIIAIDDELPGKLTKDMSGTMDCLVCETGKVKWSVARSNGHKSARCSTPGCVAFIQ